MRRGRVIIGANEAAVHSAAAAHRALRRGASRRSPSRCAACPSRQIAAAVLDRSIDFGILTFQPGRSRRADHPARQRRHRPADVAEASRSPARRRVTIEEVGRQIVIAHNDPSPTRDRVLRAYERRHDADQHPDRAAEPRRHQARGGDGDRRRAAAAPLRADRDRARPARRGEGAGARLAAPGAAGLPAHAASAAARAPRRLLDIAARRTRHGCRRNARICVEPRLDQPDDVGQASRRRLEPRRSRPAAGRSRPSCRRGTPRAPRRAAQIVEAAPPAVTLHLAQIDGDLASTDRLRPASISASSVSRRRGRGTACPSTTELPKKISENDSPMTARMPRRWMACGACSRDEPQPKFALTSSIARAAIRGIVERVHVAPRRRPAADRLRTGACSSPSNVIDFEKPRRDDAVGVDVVAAQRQRRAA